MRAWVYRNGKMTDIGTLGGRNAEAAAIDNAGEVIGFASLKSENIAGFLYKGGKMTSLGEGVYPDAISNDGVIVGSMPARAFR